MEKYTGMIIFGPPGSGKGTQSTHLIERKGVYHISTGDILRSYEGTPLGDQINSYIREGNFIPNDLMVDVLNKKLASDVQLGIFNPDKQHLLFDGFPRNTQQIPAALEVADITAVINLYVENKTVLVDRILERGKISGRADDQKESTVLGRIATYNRETHPVLEVLAHRHNIPQVNINALQSVDKVYSDISQKVLF